VRIGLLISTVTPVLVLLGILYLGRNVRRIGWLVGSALLWGGIGINPAIHFNDLWASVYSMSSLYVIGAPIVEETIKSFVLPLTGLSRRVSWFVDGAILGAASGTGFAIRENWLYLKSSGSNEALSTSIARVTSTNLMHAGATAITGAVVALVLSRGWRWRIVLPIGGLLLAMTLHSTFNRLTTNVLVSPVIVTFVGMATFGIAVGIVSLGFPISSKWVRKDLTLAGATESEKQSLSGHHVSDVLGEFGARFGREAAQKAEQLVATQRNLAIARFAGRAKESDIRILSERSDQLRLDIGMFAMMWLRSHLPVDIKSEGIWSNLDQSVVTEVLGSGSVPKGIWKRLDDEFAQASEKKDSL
jgi:RsiW-degrading membrane proteinase PrsW (M82 family)